VRSDLHEPVLTPDLATTFFRIFQETLTNIIRHAGATHVMVHLKEAAGRIILDVKDNGRGISSKEIFNTRSMGLLGMKERAALLGGTFKIGPGPNGKGTLATVSIPLRRMISEKHENLVNRRSRRRTTRLETNSRR
jgi:signal transduction histidine kinase